jgi:hypothetical protein
MTIGLPLIFSAKEASVKPAETTGVSWLADVSSGFSLEPQENNRLAIKIE